MPSSWDVYYVVFLSAGVALGIPLALAIVSRLVSDIRGKKKPIPNPQLQASYDRLGHRINARFFLGVNATLALITLVLALIPCVGIVRNADGDKGAAARALFAIVTLAGLAGLGLLYSSRKGDLSWVRSFQDRAPSKGPAE